MRVLFFSSGDFDYLQDLTYSGLVKVLGHSNVRSVPWNLKQHIPYWQYPKNIGFTGFSKSFLSTIDAGNCDLAILGASKPDAVRCYYDAISSFGAQTLTVFLDGGDASEIGGDLDATHAELLRAADRERPFDLILKREYLINTIYQDRVKPFPLSFASHFVNRVSRRGELFDVTFWAVESSSIRTRAFEILRGQFDCELNGTFRGQTLRGYSRKGVDYLQDLASSRLTINLRGVGWDTLRFWEATSLGVCTISQRPRIIIPAPFEEGKHVVYIDDSLDSLLDVCTELLADTRRRRAIGYAARAHAHKYHSNLTRSDLLLKLVEGQRKKNHIHRIPLKYTTVNQNIPVGDGLEVRLIGVILFGLMGDVLMRTRALSEVRQRYPSAVIDCFVDRVGLEVLNLTGIDCNIIFIDRASEASLKAKARKALSKVKLAIGIYRRKYDLFIDLYVSPSSRLLSRISVAPKIVIAGFEYQTLQVDGVIIRRNVGSLLSPNKFHMSLPSLSAIRMLTGIEDSVCVRPFLSPSVTTTSEPLKGGYFLLSIGAGDPSKVPSLDFLSDLVNFIFVQTSLRIKIICNPGLQKLTSDLKQTLFSAGERTEYLPFMPLGQLKHVFCDAAFFVGPDSGLLHFAYGLRTPTLGIFTFTNPNLVDPRSDLDCYLFVEDTERFQEDPVLPKGRKFTFSEVSDKVESFLARVGCSNQTKSRPGFLA